jgi:hypothetical protein
LWVVTVCFLDLPAIWTHCDREKQEGQDGGIAGASTSQQAQSRTSLLEVEASLKQANFDCS